MISQRSKRAGIKELEIFDYFKVDRNLPKYQDVPKNEESAYMVVSSNPGTITTASTSSDTNNWVAVPMPEESDSDWDEGWAVEPEPKGGKFKRWFLKKCCKKIPFKSQRRYMTISDFFSSFATNSKELESLSKISKHYETVLKQAQGMGQTALVEEIKTNLDVVKGESVLIQMGLTKYVTEEQVINFYNKVSNDENKNLQLTWIKNFGRVIPTSIYSLKRSIDNGKIFDNYVILHYDPKKIGTKLTKKEIEQKKDPILFGVIKNSRKLYFIADWKDEYCDLTLEEMFKTLKGKVGTINNTTVKNYVTKIKVE